MCMCIHMHTCISFWVSMRISGVNYLIDVMGGLKGETFTKSSFLKRKCKNWSKTKR